MALFKLGHKKEALSKGETNIEGFAKVVEVLDMALTLEVVGESRKLVA